MGMTRHLFFVLYPLFFMTDPPRFLYLLAFAGTCPVPPQAEWAASFTIFLSVLMCNDLFVSSLP